MNIPFEKSKALQKKAFELMPLGVNSNFRYWGDGITPYVKKGKGSHFWDVDGNEFIDYRMAFGPIILGHAFDEVDAKVHEEINNGVLFAMTSELELEVAKLIIDMCPAVDMVRMACSGTEATMHALRIARAYTGREKVLKFEGAYHGFHDYTLWSTYAPAETYGNRNNPVPIPSTSGIPRRLSELIITVPFNDTEVLDKTLRIHGDSIAAIITEPGLGNCASIMPEPGFLQHIREKCDEYGIVFILDEVKTGFRVANGGAQEYFNIKPDMATYAKALGNGYPVAAIGGKRKIMENIGQGLAQGGTYTNNKPGIAAAYATLSLLKSQPILETIGKRGTRLMEGMKSIFDKAGFVYTVHGYPQMLSFAFGATKVTGHRDWNDTEKDFYLELIEALIERGVMPDHDPREPWFLCYSHSDQDIDTTLTALEDAVKAVKK